MLRIPSRLRATRGSLTGVLRDGVADVWRRMPPGMRHGMGSLHRFNEAVLRAGGPPIARTRMGAGHHLLLDLRSGTEWLAFYTGAFDDLLAQHGRPKVDLIKADLEGHEDLFLAGATETVTRDRPVAFVEWNRIYYDRRGVDPTEAVFPLLRAWDYCCLRVDAHGWTSSRSFTSPRPLDDLVLAPAERLGEVREVLESQAAP